MTPNLTLKKKTLVETTGRSIDINFKPIVCLLITTLRLFVLALFSHL